ncbi:hypothetical protein D5F52_26705 (plasmid) [Brevibacillus laterosporus]|uniref:hypothetical protein n=1 Tax=Brevibacillus laterosporus TaxID=1465 RepID=UPI000E6BFBC2|nr:hypothetical protein [Brevibacillus laterosporus]AYB41747.1 hypothetical protein D5F52_26705 [Brevibacillus laterosporus]
MNGKLMKWNKIKGLLTSNRGTILLEKNVLLVVIVVAVFGFSALAYPFVKEYFGQTSNSIKNNSQINETVEW